VRELVVSDRIQEVVFYRCSPLQKSQIVAYLKGLDKCVLCVGDGDNDISMIRRADVGVAVRGVESTVATGVGDIVLDCFRLLRKTVMVHGREAHRKALMLMYVMLSKNMFVGLLEFYFGTLNNFTGSPFLESFSRQLYNIAFTFFPLIYLMFYDYEHSDFMLLKNRPNLYAKGPGRMKNIHWEDAEWALLGVGIPALTFYLSTFLCEQHLGSNGRYCSAFESAYVALFALVIYTNIKQSFIIAHMFSWFGLLMFLAGCACVPITYTVVSTFTASYIHNMAYIVREGWLYLIILVIVGVLLATDKFVKRAFQALRYLNTHCLAK
jgi:phospholipid-translocating ATPase